MKPSVPQVIPMVGMGSSRRRAGPCPACLATATRHDARPPVLFSDKSWRCVACRAGGGALSLVGYHLGVGHRVERRYGEGLDLRGRAFRHVISFIEKGEILPVAESEPEDLKRIDPMPGLRRAVPVGRCGDAEVCSWLRGRGIDASRAPAGCLRNFTADWWFWSRTHPLVVPACTGLGEIESMHARSVTDDTKRWPKNASSRELLFASPVVRSWLRGESDQPPVLVVTEGLSDYLTWSSASKVPTLGVTSGGTGALRTVGIAKGTEVFVGTHSDVSGRRYAEEVADAFAMRAVVRPLPLRRVAAVA